VGYLRTVTARRYVTPLREGGSLPAIIEADDDGLYVVKFRGAGQGPKALIAELLAGEIGRLAGLPVPEIVFMQLPAELARTEPDPEIQSLIQTSAGLNICTRSAIGFSHCLVRCVRVQRGSDGAQRQHANLAPPALAHRSRCGSVFSSRMETWR